MGDIIFNIAKDVNLNKRITLDIDKDVNVNVNNPDQLATAESDAEAFGPNALAEVDAYTLVSGGGETSRFIPNPGSIDVLGNTTDLILSGGFIPSSITVVFNGDGTAPPDVDDVNGFGSLSSLTTPPQGTAAGPPTPDGPIPDPLLSITNLNLSIVGVVIPGEEARYTNNQNWVANFGQRTLDLDGDGINSTDNLLLTVPAGSNYLAERLANGEIEVEFEAFNGNGFFTFDGKNYEVTGFVFEAESLEIGDIGDWAFEAASDFGRTIVTPTGGEAFAYAESTSALDVNPTVLPS